MCDNYPIGLNNDNAPWNQIDKPEKEIEVTVSITLSKTFKVIVNDYEINAKGIDTDGTYFEDIDYSNCNLKEAVEEQILLPQEAFMALSTACKARQDLENWNVDEFEVVLE